MSKYKIAFVFADSQREWNVSQWRSLTPSDAMNRAGWEGKLIFVQDFIDFLNPFVQDLVMSKDIIVLQRNIIHPQLFAAVHYYMGLGKPCIMDLDDEYATLPWSNPARNFWHEREFGVPHELPNGQWSEPGGALAMMKHAMRISNGLLSPNRLLLGVWQHLSGNSYYLQNYAETAWYEKLPSRAEAKKERGLENKIVIGWGGSVSHYDSWWGSGIMQAAQRICKRHPEVVWMLCGSDERFALSIPNEQIYKQPGVPPQDWPKVIKAFDIGVAPLDGTYDQFRSWIKGIEYCLTGTPWVATAGEPYRDVFPFAGVAVPNGPDAWEDSLENIISNLKAEQSYAADLIPEAKQRYCIDNQLEAWAQVCQKIIDDFDRQKPSRPLPGLFRIAAKKTTKEATKQLA